jgi:hypothetical protein
MLLFEAPKKKKLVKNKDGQFVEVTDDEEEDDD